MILINLIKIPLHHILCNFNIQWPESILHQSLKFINIDKFIFIHCFFLSLYWFLKYLWLLFGFYFGLFFDFHCQLGNLGLSFWQFYCLDLCNCNNSALTCTLLICYFCRFFLEFLFFLLYFYLFLSG